MKKTIVIIVAAAVVISSIVLCVVLLFNKEPYKLSEKSDEALIEFISTMEGENSEEYKEYYEEFAGYDVTIDLVRTYITRWEDNPELRNMQIFPIDFTPLYYLMKDTQIATAEYYGWNIQVDG